MISFQKISKLALLILTLDLPTFYSITLESDVITVPFQVFLVRKDLQDVVVSPECTQEENDFLTNALRSVIPEAIKAIKKVGTDQLNLSSNLSQVLVNTSAISIDIIIPPTKRPTMRPTRRPTKFFPMQRPTLPPPTKKPTIQATNLPTRIPTIRPIPITTNIPTDKPTISSTQRRLTDSKEGLIDSDQHTRRRLASAQFIWGGSSSWTCRGCGPDMTDYNIHIPGEDVILDSIYGIRGPTFTERSITLNITVVMQQEIDTRLKDPSIPLGCLQRSIFSTYYKDLTIPEVLIP
jgi:hypothetical protein